MERLIVRREPLENKVCPVCGKTFAGVKSRRYCSRACRNRADYERHAEQRRENMRDARKTAKSEE